jgi:hypothetical protein
LAVHDNYKLQIPQLLNQLVTQLLIHTKEGDHEFQADRGTGTHP